VRGRCVTDWVVKLWSIGDCRSSDYSSPHRFLLFDSDSVGRRNTLRERRLVQRIVRTLLARREDDPHLARGMALLLYLLVRDGDGGQLFLTYEHVNHLVHLLSTLPPPVLCNGSRGVKLKAPVIRSIARLDAACTTSLRVAGAVVLSPRTLPFFSWRKHTIHRAQCSGPEAHGSSIASITMHPIRTLGAV
jgi:hypothetical protein